MLIEIKKNIITEALKRKSRTQNAPLDLLYQMAICAKKGNHVVWVPSLDTDRSLREKLSKLITDANVHALSFAASRHQQDIGWLKRNLSVKVVISYEKEQATQGTIILNPSQNEDFEPFTELFLLVENIIDADFYKIVLKAYRQKEALKAYECNFYPLMGGGVTSVQVMAQEIQLNKHFCLAIADSDRHCPNGERGETCKALLKILSTAHPFCDVCWLVSVMEIENLIPEKIVRYLYPLKKGEIDIFSKDASYFDMKNGLHLCDLLEQKVNDYWNVLLPEKKEIFKLRAQIKFSNGRKHDFEAALKARNDELLPGFGRHLLKRVLNKDEEAKPAAMNKNIHTNHLLHQISYADLSQNQKQEWNHIGESIFAWACGMKAT